PRPCALARGSARSSAGGLRIVERDVLEDVLEVSNGSRRPPAFHFRAALRCSKRWARRRPSSSSLIVRPAATSDKPALTSPRNRDVYMTRSYSRAPINTAAGLPLSVIT